MVAVPPYATSVFESTRRNYLTSRSRKGAIGKRVPAIAYHKRNIDIETAQTFCDTTTRNFRRDVGSTRPPENRNRSHNLWKTFSLGQGMWTWWHS